MKPSVVRAVLYYDREEFVNAAFEHRTPEPYGAVVTRVHKDPEGNDLSVVNLGVFDPELGYQIKRDVHEGTYDESGKAVPEAHRWFWPFIPTAAGTRRNEPTPLQPAAAAGPEPVTAVVTTAADSNGTGTGKHAEHGRRGAKG